VESEKEECDYDTSALLACQVVICPEFKLIIRKPKKSGIANVGVESMSPCRYGKTLLKSIKFSTDNDTWESEAAEFRLISIQTEKELDVFLWWNI